MSRAASNTSGSATAPSSPGRRRPRRGAPDRDRAGRRTSPTAPARTPACTARRPQVRSPTWAGGYSAGKEDGREDDQEHSEGTAGGVGGHPSRHARSPSSVPGIEPTANRSATRQSMWPSDQCTARVGRLRAPATTRLVPAAIAVVSPSTTTKVGTSRKPPPLASRPVRSPTAKATAITRTGLASRSAQRSACPCGSGSSTRAPTPSSSTAESTRSRCGSTSEDANPPRSVPGRPPAMASRATRRSRLPLRTWSRAPARDTGSIAGSGAATANAVGTPTRASTGVAKAAPPAPNRPYRLPATTPTTRMASCSTGSSNRDSHQKSKT